MRKNPSYMSGLGLLLAFLWLAFAPSARAQEDEVPAASPKAPWISMDLGVQYAGWDSTNVLPFHGSEILAPLTLSVIPWKGGRIYGQTQYTHGDYTDSQNVTVSNNNLSAFTDTVLGLETDFKSFSLPSIVSLGFNIPTGDPTWETKQTNSIVPTQFIDGSYRGRGLGMSLLYGVSLPGKGDQYGFAAGYMYSGAFNPSYGLGAPADQLKLGDSIFLSVNRAGDHGGGQSDILRVSAFYFLPTQQNGSDLLQMGPNLNASYSWNNPKAFSFEAGGQYFLPTQQATNGKLSPEAFNSLGPRFYLSPSYVFGDLSFAARMKYILPNGYPSSDQNYDGGGWMAGLAPTVRLKLDPGSALKITAGYDFIFSNAGSHDSQGARVNVEYGHWTFGTHYEVNW